MTPQQLMSILAAILYHIDDVVKEKVKFDDVDHAKEVEHRVVEIIQQQDMVMCILPMQLLKYFAENPYRMEFQVRQDASGERQLGVLGFERVKQGPTLVSANGKPINYNTGVQKMFEEFFNPPKKEAKVDA